MPAHVTSAEDRSSLRSRPSVLGQSPSSDSLAAAPRDATPHHHRRTGGSVTGEEWALAASVVFSGLWSGLLGMLTLVMHPMLGAMDGRDFERFLRAFLPVLRKA